MNASVETLVRPYHDDDVAHLVELFERVFGSRITAEHWRWKLAHRDARARNVWLATAGDRPVFQYAGIPQRYTLDGRQLDCFVSVDTMTHPDFRRRGLLTQVASEAYAEWRAAGAGFVFGLPNQQWGSRTTALGWHELFELQWLTRPLRPERLVARRLRLPWLRRATLIAAAWNRFFDRRVSRSADIEVTEVRHADAGFDELWQYLRAETAFGCVRDKAWVQWRFLASPQRRYQVLAARRHGHLCGYLAYRTSEHDGRIVALLCEIVTPAADTAARDTLLAEFIARLRALDAEYVRTLAPPGTALFEWLRRVGFLGGAGFSVQLVPLAADLPLERMADARAWRLSGADFDVV